MGLIEASKEWLFVIGRHGEPVDCRIKNVTNSSVMTTLLNREPSVKESANWRRQCLMAGPFNAKFSGSLSRPRRFLKPLGSCGHP